MRTKCLGVATGLLLVWCAGFLIVPAAGATVSGTVILPWVPNNDPTGGLGPWYGRIEIQNPSSDICSVIVSVPSNSGGWRVSVHLSIDAHGLADLSPDDAGVQQPGSALMIASTGCAVAAAVKQASTNFSDPPWSFGATAVTGYTGIPGADSASATEWILPIVQTNNDWNSYIRVTNVESTGSSNVTIQIFPYQNDDGYDGAVLSQTVLLKAGATHTMNLFAALQLSGFVGFARVTSEGSVVAMVQREKPAAQVALINVASAHAPGEVTIQSIRTFQLEAPIVFNAYNGWNTGINLANPNASVANVTISYPGAGRPDDNVSVQPYSSDYVYTPANASGQTDFTGNAVIYSDQPVGAVVDEVKYATNDGISYSAVPGLSSQVAVPLVFKQARSGSRNDNSGINVSNARDHQTTVEITIYDKSGAQTGGSYDLTIPAHASNFIYLPSKDVAPDTVGTAIIVSLDGAPIVAVSNDVAYDVAGGGSTVFNAPSLTGLYQIGVNAPAPSPQ